MPDITKCSNNDCPLRHSCYRYQASDSQRQSYAKFEFTINAGKYSCNYYWTTNTEVNNKNYT